MIIYILIDNNYINYRELVINKGVTSPSEKKSKPSLSGEFYYYYYYYYYYFIQSYSTEDDDKDKNTKGN